MMEEAPGPRLIVYHASRDALGPKTIEIMGRLGYQIMDAEVYESRREAETGLRPDLLLVDDRRLVEATVYEDDGDALPIVLLCGPRGATGADSRVVGAVKRPSGLHELFRLMQQVFEETPRSTPRIATQLRARVGQGDRVWDGRVLSLSENGCLMRSPESIALGQKLELELVLPNSGRVSLDAEAAYQLMPDVGLVFNTVSPAHRESLSRFVSQTLMAA